MLSVVSWAITAPPSLSDRPVNRGRKSPWLDQRVMASTAAASTAKPAPIITLLRTGRAARRAAKLGVSLVARGSVLAVAGLSALSMGRLGSARNRWYCSSCGFSRPTRRCSDVPNYSDLPPQESREQADEASAVPVFRRAGIAYASAHHGHEAAPLRFRPSRRPRRPGGQWPAARQTPGDRSGELRRCHGAGHEGRQRLAERGGPAAARGAAGQPQCQPGRDHGGHAEGADRLPGHLAGAQPAGLGLLRNHEYAGLTPVRAARRPGAVQQGGAPTASGPQTWARPMAFSSTRRLWFLAVLKATAPCCGAWPSAGSNSASTALSTRTSG